MPSNTRKQTLAYSAVVAGCFAIGMIAGWPATRFNNYAYDWLLTGEPAENWAPQSVIVAIDEQTFREEGGVHAIRTILAKAMLKIAAAGPKAVASDVTLPDRTIDDPAVDQRLADALAQVPNLVLPCDLITVGGKTKWEDPLPDFAKSAVALGHVFRGESGTDGVDRVLPLEEIVDGKRRWALALEAFAVAHRDPIPIDSPDDVQVGGVIIPAPRRADGRQLLIRYLSSGNPYGFGGRARPAYGYAARKSGVRRRDGPFGCARPRLDALRQAGFRSGDPCARV